MSSKAEGQMDNSVAIMVGEGGINSNGKNSIKVVYEKEMTIRIIYTPKKKASTSSQQKLTEL